MSLPLRSIQALFLAYTAEEESPVGTWAPLVHWSGLRDAGKDSEQTYTEIFVIDEDCRQSYHGEGEHVPRMRRSRNIHTAVDASSSLAKVQGCHVRSF